MVPYRLGNRKGAFTDEESAAAFCPGSAAIPFDFRVATFIMRVIIADWNGLRQTFRKIRFRHCACLSLKACDNAGVLVTDNIFIIEFGFYLRMINFQPMGAY
jgi:hypothetical protein